MTLARLKAFVAVRPVATMPDAAELCEFCAVPVEEGHRHVVDVEQRSLRCACRACSLLFWDGTGRYRTVPDAVRRSEIRIEDLDIPVGLAFVLHDSKLGRPVAFYPSPAGALESGVTLPTVDLRPDVEALLLSAERGSYVVPVDRCYELSGLVGKGEDTKAFFDRIEAAAR